MNTVENVETTLRDLVYRRQRLRGLGAGPRVLERNDRAIVAAQWELYRALVDRYRPPAA